ncbi:DEBR0S2_09252g1_1 [Brettanomyces bruxellensis]|uniref:Pre-mRNA-splicing factor 38 n=2 Tax=Dekkera bruxellensis TaxID=5007 RepID=A0A7D9CZR4_DEKBR|nr:DEBR0S2_09252g1_1 [Brettanomyces bruxellensis]
MIFELFFVYRLCLPLPRIQDKNFFSYIYAHCFMYILYLCFTTTHIYAHKFISSFLSCRDYFPGLPDTYIILYYGLFDTELKMSNVSKTSSTKSVITTDVGLAYGVSKIHGVNPVLLIEKILRERILYSLYWQQPCVTLNLMTLLDEVVFNVKLIGTYSDAGKVRPTRFICIILRLLQIQPTSDIIAYLLQQNDFKYLQAIAALYVRITMNSIDIYKNLEPLLSNYCRLRIYESGKSYIIHMDEYIDNLLTGSSFCDLTFPRIVRRDQLEETGKLDERLSSIRDDFEKEVEEQEEGQL